MEKENIWNLPNILTLCRILIAFLIIYFIFADFSIIYIVIAFIIGMLTDFFDGQIAKIFNLKTEFGRKFDMIADRVLIVGVILAVIIKFSQMGILTKNHFFQIFFILSREMIAFPFLLIAAISGKGIFIPQVRFIGKAATVMQAITFPMILLNISYKVFTFSLYFAIATGAIGLISSFYYINDMKNLKRKKK